jgi:hypothetical protein
MLGVKLNVAARKFKTRNSDNRAKQIQAVCNASFARLASTSRIE